MNAWTFRSSFSLLASLLFISAAVNAQAKPSMAGMPSYEVSLQVIVGSDDPVSKSELPRNLAGVAAQLRSSYPFPSYRVANTYLGRLGNAGMVEYKSVSNIFGEETSGNLPSFLEWSLGGSRNPETVEAGNVFIAQSFKFGARIPLNFPRYDDGKAVTTVSYESIGLTTNRASIREGEPTLIGSLALPKTAGTLFLVLTVKPVL